MKNNGVFNFEGIHWVILSPGPARGIVSPGKLTLENWLFYSYDFANRLKSYLHLAGRQVPQMSSALGNGQGGKKNPNENGEVSFPKTLESILSLVRRSHWNWVIIVEPEVHRSLPNQKAMYFFISFVYYKLYSLPTTKGLCLFLLSITISPWITISL